MTRGMIVVDVDGTIARRDCGLSGRLARLFRNLIRLGWRVFVLTGRTLENVEPRVLVPIRAASHDPFELVLFTCEGARRWNYSERGASPVAVQEVFAPLVRKEIGEQASRALVDVSAVHRAKILEEPSWWEDSLLVFKVEAESLDRLAIMREIQDRLSCDAYNLRIGIAGRTTIVITHVGIHKGAALREIRSETPRELPVLYVADEFEAPGNDAAALEVPGILCVSVGAPMWHCGLLADLGHGPRGAYCFLSWVERLSRGSLLSGSEIIAASVRKCDSFSSRTGSAGVAGHDTEEPS